MRISPLERLEQAKSLLYATANGIVVDLQSHNKRRQCNFKLFGAYLEHSNRAGRVNDEQPAKCGAIHIVVFISHKHSV